MKKYWKKNMRSLIFLDNKHVYGGVRGDKLKYLLGYIIYLKYR